MVSTAGGIVIAIVVIALAAAVGWVVFTQYRARRLGVSNTLALPVLPLVICHPLAGEMRRCSSSLSRRAT